MQRHELVPSVGPDGASGPRVQGTNLGPLAGLTGLQSLNCERMPVVDLAPLAALTGLQSLNIRGTPAIDRTPLAALPHLNVVHSMGRFRSTH
jgi:internalin A